MKSSNTMSSCSKSLLQVGGGVRKLVLENFGRTEESIVDDVKTIREWLQVQPHLPEILHDKAIEKFLLLNKLCIERTKQKIDMYYTIRSLMPELFENKNPKLAHMKAIVDVMYWIPLPKLTDDLYRVFVYKIADGDADKFDPYIYFANTLLLAEIRLMEDYSMGDIYVYDFHGMKVGHLAKLTPTVLMRIGAVVEKVYSNRVKSIHYINCPTFIDTIVNVCKNVLKPKIANRMYVHRDLKSLHQHVPKRMLPSDLDGDERPLSELNEIVKEKLAEYQDRYDKLDEMRVNESLRPEKLANDDILGFYGNFRKLNVD